MRREWDSAIYFFFLLLRHSTLSFSTPPPFFLVRPTRAHFSTIFLCFRLYRSTRGQSSSDSVDCSQADLEDLVSEQEWISKRAAVGFKIKMEKVHWSNMERDFEWFYHPHVQLHQEPPGGPRDHLQWIFQVKLPL